MAGNSESFVEAVRERTGIEVEIISGDEEARLAYVAVTSEMQLGDGSLVLFGAGGGSSQFTFGHGEKVDERFSVDVGAVRFAGALRPRRSRVRGEVGPRRSITIADRPRTSRRPADAGTQLVGIGGAVTNLAAVHARAPDTTSRTSSAGRSSTARKSTASSSSTGPRPRISAARSPASSRSALRSSSPAPASSGPYSRSSAATRSRSAIGGCAMGCSGNASDACSVAPDGGARRHVPRRGLALGRRAAGRSRRRPPRLRRPAWMLPPIRPRTSTSRSSSTSRPPTWTTRPGSTTSASRC